MSTAKSSFSKLSKMGALLSTFAAVLMVCSCSLLRKPDPRIKNDAEAAWIYHDARYHKLCVGAVAGPPQCKKYQAAIDELNWQVQTAKKVVVIGSFPPEERRAIAAAEKAVAILP